MSPLPVDVDTQYKNTVVEDEEKDTRNHSGPGYDRRRRRQGGRIYFLEFHCVRNKLDIKSFGFTQVLVIQMII